MRGAVRRLPAPPEVAAELDQVLAQADRTIAEARGAVWDLRAPGGPGEPARDLPGELAAAVRDLTAGRPVAADVEVVGTPRPCPAETHAHLVRIAREAVANAVAHGGAAAVRVRLRYDRGAVRLTVHDDGCGFDATRAAPAGHWGLVGMRERAARAGGTVVIDSAPGAGTTVTAVLPA